MSVTVPVDYTGRYSITKNVLNTAKIQQFISEVEPGILNRLFGVELFLLYEQGMLENPIDPIWLKLYEPFFFQSDCGKLYESKGIKVMLLGFVYFQYYADTYSQASVNGNVVDVPELSKKANDMDSNLISRQNESVKTYTAIQEYIKANRDTYPTYNGVKMLLTNWF